MNRYNTGGPAFPHHVVCDKGWAETQELQGMTLRDYFAAKAMIFVMPDVIKELQKGYLTQEKTDKLKTVACEACYGIADAMLSARGTEKRGNNDQD